MKIDENEMTFGQILAILLLVAPVVPIVWALGPLVRRGCCGHDGAVIK